MCNKQPEQINRLERLPDDCVCGKFLSTNMMLVQIRGHYDGALFFMCTNCDQLYHRWPKGTYQRDMAEAYLYENSLQAL